MTNTLHAVACTRDNCRRRRRHHRRRLLCGVALQVLVTSLALPVSQPRAVLRLRSSLRSAATAAALAAPPAGVCLLASAMQRPPIAPLSRLWPAPFARAGADVHQLYTDNR
jgi:hypothetical protein